MSNSLKVNGTPPQLAMILTLIQSAEYTALEPVGVPTLTTDSAISTTLDDDIVNAEQTFSQTASPAATETPPPPSATEAVELAKDSTGAMIPWDARIHGKAKKKNADDSWKFSQGIDRVTLVPQVEAELRAQMVGAPVDTPAPVETPAPVDTGTPSTFVQLLPLITAGRASGNLTNEKMQETADLLGLPNIGALNNRPDLIKQATDLLGLV